jgi:hypothetical protein
MYRTRREPIHHLVLLNASTLDRYTLHARSLTSSRLPCLAISRIPARTRDNRPSKRRYSSRSHCQRPYRLQRQRLFPT